MTTIIMLGLIIVAGIGACEVIAGILSVLRR